MTQKRPKSFVLYADFEAALLQMSIRERGILFTMIYSYACRGTVDESAPIPRRVDMAFAIIRAQLDRDREKYEKICEKNAENARLGGRPKTERNRSVSKKPYNNNYNKNNNYTDTDNDNEFGIESSFDSAEFFAAALARSYAEDEENEKKEKEEK